MTDIQTRTASIPFGGFYESAHDYALQSALEQMFSDDSGCETTPAYDIAVNAIDWRTAFLAYAQKYCENLASETESTWQFDKLDSPRFYNYRSDAIDVIVPLAELHRMRRYILDNCESDWIQLCKDRLTARDGFIPYYDANPYTWGTLDDWEAPQLSLLIECYCAHFICENLTCSGTSAREWLACECVDDCNGDISDCIQSAIPDQAWERINAMESECEG